MEPGVEPMKSRPYIVSIAIVASVVACNRTVGDCWPVGQGDTSVDVGSGVINSTGPGNPGDTPTGQAEGALSEAQCNEPDESGAGGGGGSSKQGTYVRCWGLGPA